MQWVISCPCHHYLQWLDPTHATASAQNGRDGDSEAQNRCRTLP
jgi:hypothetical protein